MHNDKLILVDAFSLIYRAFYAIRSLTGPDGQPVNAVYGFTKMIRRLIATHQPSLCAIVFDCGAPQRRLALLPSYKEQRPPTPPDLESQLPAIREILLASHLAIAEIPGEEADDIVATIAAQAAAQEMTVLIASQDKDFCQIISPRINLLRPDPPDAPPMDAKAVQARYGVTPEQMVDFLSLVGDSVDNIPGVSGIGEKTAADLLRQYATIDNLLLHAPTLDKPRLRGPLQAAADRLRANRELIRLHTDIPLPWSLNDFRLQPPDEARLRELFTRCGFRSLLAELGQRNDGELLLGL